MKNAAADNTPATNRAVLWLILTTFLWGGSFVFNKIAFRDIPPLVFLALRFSLAALAMAALAGGRWRQLNVDLLRRGAVVGLALAGANVTFVLGVNGTTVSRAGFLNNLFVLIIPLVCFLLWRTRVDRWTLAGVVIAGIGLLQLAGGGLAGSFNRGDLFSTACAFFISCHILAVSRLLKGGDVVVVTCVQFVTVAVVGTVAALFVPHPPLQVTTLAMVSLVYCVIFPTMICFTLQNTYQRFVTPTQAGLIYTLDPIWVLLGGIFVLGERLRPGEWLGCGLIFAAVVLPLIGRMWREHRRRGGEGDIQPIV
jgi:drug/metabolite transporter (DMT)-like permease